jgi:hypothetical protein
VANRFVRYVKVYKAQYWLEEIHVDMNLLSAELLRFRTQARIDRSNWFRWNPPRNMMLIAGSLDESRYITETDWLNIANFVTRNLRLTLVLELLSNAENILHKAYRRSAVIEAVSALEMAVDQFCKFPAHHLLRSDVELRPKILKSLHSQSEHLGFSTTFKYLIPLLLGPNQLPNDLLSSCNDAIDTRNQLVRGGQRDVSPERASTLVQSVRSACLVLRGLTSSSTS